MIEWRHYAYEHYTVKAAEARAEVVRLKAKLEMEQLTGSMPEIEATKTELLYARALVNNVVDKQFSNKRVYDKQLNIIDELGLELPETFPDGKNYKVCPQCRERHDTVDYMSIVSSGIKWYDICAKCRFDVLSAKATERVKKRNEATKKYVEEMTEQLCGFCGYIKPLTEFKVNHVYLHSGKIKYESTCKSCRSRIANSSFNRPGKNTNKRRELPFIYNPSNPSQCVPNPKFFFKDFNVLSEHDREIVTTMLRDIIEQEQVTLMEKERIAAALNITDEQLKQKIYLILKGELK